MSDIRHGGSSEVGSVRDVQEDSMLTKTPLFAVADGMGGHRAGDVASSIAIGVLEDLDPSDTGTLVESIAAANKAIHERSISDRNLKGMGTTLTAIYAGPKSVSVAHVGDSRAYLFREGELERLTRDHTPVARLVETGRISPEDADRHPQRSYLERALGVESEIDVDVSVVDTQEGDRFLICSDGLYGMLSEERIIEVLDSEDDPQAAADLLCHKAVEAGGYDNVTTIVVDYPGVRKNSIAKPRPRARNRRIYAWLAGLLALILLALGGTFAALRTSWYVGEHNDRVAVFNGVPGTFGGIDLAKVSRTTEIRVVDLPEPEQRRVQEGIKASGRDDAQQIVANLDQLTRPKPQ